MPDMQKVCRSRLHNQALFVSFVAIQIGFKHATSFMCVCFLKVQLFWQLGYSSPCSLMWVGIYSITWRDLVSGESESGLIERRRLWTNPPFCREWLWNKKDIKLLVFICLRLWKDLGFSRRWMKHTIVTRLKIVQPIEVVKFTVLNINIKIVRTYFW